MPSLSGAAALLSGVIPRRVWRRNGGCVSRTAARRHQSTGVLMLWIAGFFEILFNAAAVHWDILRQDLRYTSRTLLRSSGFADNRDSSGSAGHRRQHRGVLGDGFRAHSQFALSRSGALGQNLADRGGLRSDGIFAPELSRREANEQIVRSHGRLHARRGESGGTGRSPAY